MPTADSLRKAVFCTRALSLAAAGVAGVVWLGWLCDIESFKSLVSGLAAMNPCTAVTFALAAASVYSLTFPSERGQKLANLFAATVLFVGMLKLAIVFGHAGFDFDTVLFHDQVIRQFWNGNPNHMAPITGLCFCTLGSAILLRSTWTQRGQLLSLLLLLFQSLFALVALLAYLYGARSLSDFGGYLPMTLPTSLIFLALAFATVLALPQCSVMKLMLSPGETGLATQRLMMAGIGAPLLLGWITLKGQNIGLYSPMVSVAIFCVLTTLCFASLTLWHGFTLLDMQRRRMSDEEDLRESEERFRLLSNSAFEALAVAIDGTIVDVNQEFCRVFRYDYDEVIGKRSADFVALDSKKDVEGHILAESEDIYNALGLRADGSTFDIEVWGRMLPLRGQRGRVTAVRDITQRRRVERMKDEFVSVVNHELRTPLTSIHGALGLMVNGMTGELPPAASQMTDVALRNTKRLLTLINDLLDMQKIEAGEVNFESVEFDLGHLIAANLEAIKAYGEKLSVSFQADLGSAPVKVSSDSDRLTQVLTNLLSNAAKFSPPGGTVTVKMSERHGLARVEVHDDGAGIPAEFQARVFDKFAQADSSATRQAGGTGLGLSICKSIMEILGGKIGFNSSEDAGTTFFIELPAYSVEVKSQDLTINQAA